MVGPQTRRLESSRRAGMCSRKKRDSVQLNVALTVRNTDDGRLELVTQHGLFFPNRYQKIVEVRGKILLEPYETVAVRDPTGRFYSVPHIQGRWKCW